MDTRRRRGFTLTEVVVGSVILVLIGGAVWSMMIFGQRNTRTAMLQSDCTLRAGLAFERICREFEKSERVLFPECGARAPYLLLQHWSGARRVIHLSANGEYILLRSLDDSSLWSLAETARTSLLFSRLEFENVGNEEVRFTLSFGQRSGERIPLFTQVFTGKRPRNVQ